MKQYLIKFFANELDDLEELLEGELQCDDHTPEARQRFERLLYRVKNPTLVI